MIRHRSGLSIAACLVAASIAFMTPVVASAGPIFLTGHDPDFHSQPLGGNSAGAQRLFRSGLNFVTGGTYSDLNPLTPKFLWVEGRPFDPNDPLLAGGVPGGHLIGETGLTSLGLVLGVQYDRADAVEFASATLSNYSAIVIASSFGGLLTKDELNALIARRTDIQNYINAGGGLMALAECVGAGSCNDVLMPGVPAADLFSYLPVTVSSIAPTPPFNVTPAGAAPPFNLTNGDVNDPTHNSFGLIGGLTALDLDSGNPHQATTLAGNVTIDDGGFTPVPEPASLLLLGAGLAGIAAFRRRRH